MTTLQYRPANGAEAYNASAEVNKMKISESTAFKILMCDNGHMVENVRKDEYTPEVHKRWTEQPPKCYKTGCS